MRYRTLSETGDYVFGRSGQFLIDSPSAVAQAVKTRLLLWTNEWFLDLKDGTDYMGRILGHNTSATRDIEVKSRILETPGVVQLLEYVSDLQDRRFSVSCLVETQYGSASVEVTVDI